jgi:hypothetical protein
MLRVSDVWERALHAPGMAFLDPEELEGVDSCPVGGDPRDHP